MKKLEELVAKYKLIMSPNDAVRSAIVEVIRESFKVDIPKTDISVRGSTVFIKASSVLKNEIALNKKIILDLVVRELGQRAPKEIR